MTRTVVDIAPLLDGGPWTRYQKLLTALVALAILLDGFDIQILGFAVPSLMKEWGVARATFGPVLATGLAGMAIGSGFAGPWGDRLGRRPTLIICIVIFGVATLATAFAGSIAMLTALRFVTGFGAGGAIPNVSAMAAEFAPAARRALTVKLTIICVPLGGMVGGAIAAVVLPAFGWRALYHIGGALPLLLALVIWAVLPESPRFLAQPNRDWRALRKLLRRLGHDVPADAEFTDSHERSASGRSPVASLFSDAHLRDTIGLWIAFFFCLGSVYLVFGWLPAMLSSFGLNVATASEGLAVYNFGGVLGVLIWAALTGVFGSRMPLVLGALAAGVSAAAVLLVPTNEHGLLLGALGMHGLFANAVQTSMYALAAHVYPTPLRATGVAWCASIGRVGGITTSVFGARAIGHGASAYFTVIAAAMAIAAIGLAAVRTHYGSARHSGSARKVQ